jgi:hypothetical protein
MKGDVALDVTSLGMAIAYLFVILAGTIGVLLLLVLLFKEKPKATATRNERASPEVGRAGYLQAEGATLAPTRVEIEHQEDRAA